MTGALFLIVCGAGPAVASFEKGGLLGAPPRSVALAGADLALPGAMDAAAGEAASYTLLNVPALVAAYGVTTEGALGGLHVSAGGTWGGLGVAGSFDRRAAGGVSERRIGIGAGVPVEEVPGLSFGARLTLLATDLGGDAASGVAADLSVSLPLPSPVGGLELRGALAADDAFGSLDWESGLEERMARQIRIGAAGRWRDRITGYAEARLIRGPLGREAIGAAGAEYVFAVIPHPVVGELELAPRLGWRGGDARDGAVTGGLGIARGPVRLDYALAGPTPGQGTLHVLSAGYRLEGFSTPGTRRMTPATAISGGDAGAAVPEVPSLRFDTPYTTLRIAVAPPKGFIVETWAVLVLDSRGEVVWSAEGNGVPPGSVEWNGGALNGTAAPAGSYECRLAARGPGAFRSFSAGTPFRLIRPSGKPLPEPDGPGGF